MQFYNRPVSSTQNKTIIKKIDTQWYTTKNKD